MKPPYLENYMVEFVPAVTAEKIQAYLVKINSWLKDKICQVPVLDEAGKPKKNEDGKIITTPKSFNQFIYDLCDQYKINQIYVLALIQKEQSALFTSKIPSEHIQNKIVGYAITESGKIPGYDGFEMQFMSAIKQLRRYDKWSQVTNLETVRGLCDDAEDRQCLREMGVESTSSYKPANIAEAKSMLYTPRMYPLIQMGQLYKKIEASI